MTILDAGKPVVGATVELHSIPRKTVTDIDGIARFSNVEKGDHTLYLAYNGYLGQEKITLAGEDAQIDIQIAVTLKKHDFFLSPQALAIIAGLLGVVMVLILLLVRVQTTGKRSR